jgi:hypothetical protein
MSVVSLRDQGFAITKPIRPAFVFSWAARLCAARHKGDPGTQDSEARQKKSLCASE